MNSLKATKDKVSLDIVDNKKIDSKIMRNSPKIFLRYIQCLLILFASFLLNNLAFAEGTADINQYGGDRVVTIMEGNGNINNTSYFGMTTDVYAYAEEGETINMAFTKNVNGWGYIEYFSPTGAAYRCEIPGLFAPIKEGFIESAAEEFAGPGAVGGYTPCEHQVGMGEDGVWKVEFVSTIGGSTGTWQTQGNSHEAADEWAVSPGDPGAAFTQFITGQDVRWGSIIAWDVTVSAGTLGAGGIAIPGRVFVTQFVGEGDRKCVKDSTNPCNLQTAGSGGIASHKFFIQTEDGYTFDLLTNAPMPGNDLGYEPYSYVLFANNKGVTDGSGDQTFHSTTQADINNSNFFIQKPDFAEPTLANCPECKGHKIFFSLPSSDIPGDQTYPVAIRSTKRNNIPGANQTIFGPNRNNLGVFPIISASGITTGNTWLVNTLEVPEFSNFNVIGIEGTTAQVGEGMGGFIEFECQPASGAPVSVCNDIGPGGTIVNLAIDFTGDGSIDLVIPNLNLSVGMNQVPWDGTDDNSGGTPVPAAMYNTATIQLQGTFGEVHFPTIDAEHNTNGWTLGRLNGPAASMGSPDYHVFWDDTTVGGDQSALGGEDSSGGAHDWDFDVGDVNVIDTYSFATFDPVTVPFEIKATDLRVTSVATDVGVAVQHGGDTVEFTVNYINDGLSAAPLTTLFFDVDSAFFENLQFTAASCVETILPGNLPLPTQTSCGPDTNGNVSGSNYARTSVYVNPGDQVTFKLTADIIADNLLPLTPGTTGPSSANIGSILRSADCFDLHATNPDAAPPTSVQAECESNTSVDAGTDYPGGATNFGTDCNNADNVIVNIERYDGMPAIAKDASITNNDDGTYTVGITLNIENAGLTDLFDVQITDDIVAAVGTFNAGATMNSNLSPGEYYIPGGGGVSIDSIMDNNTPGNALLTANPGFNGFSDQNLLLVSNVNPSQLGAGDTAVISFTIVVNPDFDDETIAYENSAEISGDFVEDFSVDGDVTKLSNDGVVPDPDNASPTPILLPKIGLAKTVNSLTAVGAINGAFDVQLQFIVENLGNVDLTNIALTDDLTVPFGTFVNPSEVTNPGEYRILIGPSDVTDAGSTITTNMNFNGDGNQLIAGDANDLLQIGDSSSITLTVRFIPDFDAPIVATYLNVANASGEDADGTTTQVQSANGTDPTQSPFPGDTPDPTPIPTGGIRVTKELINGPTEVEPCAKSITYRITTENLGTVPLYDIRITEDLASSDFGAYNSTATGAGDLADSGEYFFPAPGITQSLNNNSGNSALTLNTNYDGESDIDLLTLTLNDVLQPGDSVVHEITMIFTPDFENPSSDLYDNVAFAYGDIAENGSSDEDISDVSDNLAANLVNDPNTPAPVPLPLPELALLKIAEPVTQNVDGTYNTIFKIHAKNIGNIALFNIQIHDALAPSFGTYNNTAVNPGDLSSGEYYISTAPSLTILNGAPVLTLDTSYDGNSNIDFFLLNAGNTMAVNDEIEIEFTITTNRLFQIGATDYINQATSHAYSNDDVNNNIPPDPDNPNNDSAFNRSNNGSYFDPNNPNDFCSADNSEPTPSPAPLFDLDKSRGTLTENGDGTFSIDYTLTIENTFVNGIAIPDIFDFQVTEDLATTFGMYNASPTLPGQYNVTGLAVNVTVDGPAINPTVLSIDNTFNGSGQQNMLLVDNVSGYVFRAGDTIEVTYTINFIPNFGSLNIDSFDNMFSIAGDEVEDGTIDGQFFDESNEVELPLPRIGVSKLASNITYDTVTDTYSSDYTLYVENFGNRDLFDIFVRDDLTTNFGTYVGGVPANAGEYTITAGPTINNAAGGAVITVNGSFDGGANQDLVNGQAMGTILPIGGTFEINFSVQLHPDTDNLSYLNSATASGYLIDDASNDPDNVMPDATDDSTNAVDPANDPVANPNPDNPTDPNEYTSPTPLPLGGIQVEKIVEVEDVSNDNCAYQIKYTITTTNVGTTPLYDVRIIDDLASFDFGTYDGAATDPSDLASGEYFFPAPGIVQTLNNNSGNSALTQNGSYNGDSDIELLTLTANDVLQPGDSVVHEITISFSPLYESLDINSYDNLAFAYGDFAENGTSEGDVSDVSSGADINDPNFPVPVPLDVPQIAVLKIAEPVVQNMDDTYNTVFKIRAKNVGNRDLFNVQVRDLLAPSFGTYNNAATGSGDLVPGEYYISIAPALNILSGAPVLTLNTGFDGSSDANILSLNTGDVLNIGDEIEIEFTITTNRLFQVGATDYINQAIAYGYITDDVNNNIPGNPDDPTDADTFDTSNDASYYDPNNPNDFCSADNSEPTPSPAPLFDLDKSRGILTENGDGTFSIDYTLTIENTFVNGIAIPDIFDFQVTEDLATTFGMYNASPTLPGQYNVTGLAVNVTVDGPAINPTVLSIDNTFNGSGQQNMLLVDNVSGYVFRAGDTIEVTYTINFIPNFGSLNIDSFDNMFSIAGDEVEDGTTDGQFFDESNEVELPLPRIGVSKLASNEQFDPNTQRYTVDYTIYVQNYGNRPLYDIFVEDDMSNFGTYVAGIPTSAGEYTITSGPTVSNVSMGSGITANSGFNGAGDIDLIDGQAMGTALDINGSFQIDFSVDFFADKEAENYENSATASGYLIDDASNDPDNVMPDATDDSTNAVDPANDPVANPNPDNPTDPNEYTSPTPITLLCMRNEKVLVSGPTNNSDGTYTAVYKVTTFNIGNVPLYDVQVTEDLEGAGFGNHNNAATMNSDLATNEYYFATAVSGMLNNNSGNSAITFNGSYDGDSDINLLTLVISDVLQPGDSIENDIEVTFKPNYGSLTVNTYDNVSFAFGDEDADGTTDGDVSDASDNLDENLFNDPNTQVPVPLPLPQIAVLKDAVDAVEVDDCIYDIAFTLRLKNIGNRDLFNVQLYDILTQFGSFNSTANVKEDLSEGEYFISSVPNLTVINGSPSLTLNNSYNGGDNAQIDNELFTLTTNDIMNIGDEVEIKFSMTLFYDKDGTFTYTNQGIGYGYLTDDINNNAPADPTNPTDADTNDFSNDNTYVDTTDQDDVDPTDNNDPTLVAIPKFELTKEIESVNNNGDGSLTANYKLTIVNEGTVDLFDLQARDNLATTFGAYNAIPTSPGEYNITGLAVAITGASVIAVDNTFNGDTQQDILLVDNVSGYVFEKDDTLEITFAVNFIPNFGMLVETSFDNKFSVFADLEENGTVDEEYTAESKIVKLPLPRIGISKVVENSTYSDVDGSFTIDYRLYIENYGNVELYDIFVQDELATNFGTYVVGAPTGPGEYTISTAPAVANVGGSSSVTANSGFDGDSDTDLIDGQAIGTVLAIGEGFEITFSIQLIANAASLSYDNNAAAHGYLVDDAGNDPDNVTPDTTDDSTNFTDPIDPATNPNPDNSTDPNEYTSPTPLPLPLVCMAKDHLPVITNSVAVGDGTFDITFRLFGENYGNVDLYDVQIVDSLAQYGTLGTLPLNIGEYIVMSAPAFAGSDYGFILNANYDGQTDTDIFDVDASNLNNAIFPANNAFEINYTIRFYYDWTEDLGLIYENQGTITAATEPSTPPIVVFSALSTLDSTTTTFLNVAPGAALFAAALEDNVPPNLSDPSQDGGVSDPDGDGAVDDNNAPTEGELGQIAPAKEATRVELMPSGLYEIDYVIRAENTGNDPVLNLEIEDSLVGPRGVGTTYVAGVPAALGEYTLSTPTIAITFDGVGIPNSTLPLNTNYNGETDINFLDTPNIIRPNNIATIEFTVTLFPPDLSPIDPEDPHFNENGEYEIDNQFTVRYPTSGNQEIVRDSYVYDNGPLDPTRSPEPVTIALALPELGITKTANKQVVTVGDIVTWTITITNNSESAVSGLEVRDTLPLGLSYLPGSSFVNGVALEPDSINGNVLSWDIEAGEFPMGLPPGESFDIIIATTVTPVSSNTTITNVADILIGGQSVARAEATVRIEDDPLMTCAEVIGEVYSKNTTGKEGVDTRIGLARTILYTPEGLKVTTDDRGKFHISCVDVASNRGINFMMKLDERSLPLGYRVKSENPRVVRLTKGKSTKINFEVGVDREVSITLDDSNFLLGTALLNDESSRYLRMLMEELVTEKSVLSITIHTTSFDPELKALRKEQMENVTKQLWKKVARNPYKLEMQIQTLSY